MEDNRTKDKIFLFDVDGTLTPARGVRKIFLHNINQ